MRIKWSILALCAVLFLVSCGENEPDEPVLQPELTAVAVQLDAAAGSTFLSVTASKDWTISVSGGTWTSVNPSSGSGSRNSVILSYEANEGEEQRSITLTLNATPGGSTSLSLTQKGVNKQNPEVPQFGYGYDVAAPHWLELPATKAGDGKEWFAHDMSGGDYFAKRDVSRNWSFYYDYSSYLATWVAYPLNKGLIGSGNRTNAWGYDPLMPQSLQQAVVQSAYGTGHTRGHQLPSADRLSYTANVSTFYATNMTPQDYDFNCGIWADLEQKVRSYASSSDTLYVVTGCYVDDRSNVISDREGHLVRVPSGYFKALLRYMPKSTYGDYMACGYYLPHDTQIASGKFQDYMMSISDLEKKTGIEFFVNLADKVGADNAQKIKSQEPVSWWK